MKEQPEAKPSSPFGCQDAPHLRRCLSNWVRTLYAIQSSSTPVSQLRTVSTTAAGPRYARHEISFYGSEYPLVRRVHTERPGGDSRHCHTAAEESRLANSDPSGRLKIAVTLHAPFCCAHNMCGSRAVPDRPPGPRNRFPAAKPDG